MRNELQKRLSINAKETKLVQSDNMSLIYISVEITAQQHPLHNKHYEDYLTNAMSLFV
jgi:hypothetical protein